MMGPLQFTAILAFGIGRGLQGVVRAALSAARDGNFLLRYCHGFTFSSKLFGTQLGPLIGPSPKFRTRFQHINS